jgi:hypothetical protein
MTVLSDIVLKIITQQEAVIGPLAWNEASKVQGLHVERDTRLVEVRDADQRAVVDRLVTQYERLFGKASHFVCKQAAATLLATMSKDEIPLSLR